jgi:uncharacterized membrane protein YsdA (DUF1294 family)
MGFDKVSARSGSGRIPELWLTFMAIVGGFGGVVFGMLAFHHKVSKTSFQLKIGAAAIISVLVLLSLYKGR